ncbi:hypothetical protein UPYG_G00245190 [Umbra pygmaea]|uniref:Uncharacterized protein n=1 Tax=Umbra pygmaea TaxID=75934 RepID=A0ABD0X0C8_UMBPY
MMGVLKILSAVLLLSLLPPGLPHVVESFSKNKDCEKFFLDGITPTIPGVLVNGIVQDQNRFKPICQMFNNVYRFATLYDTTNKIPVFSAYTYNGIDGDGIKRPAWKIEPQLDQQVDDGNMALATPGVVYPNQAVKEDYWGQRTQKN